MTKELKKKHSSRPLGGVETGNQEERTHGKAMLEDQGVPHLRVDKSGGTTGEQERLHNPGFQRREIKPQNLRLKKPVGVQTAAGETPSLTGEFIGETHRSKLSFRMEGLI